MNASERAERIARYKDGPRVLREAVAGLSGAQLDAQPADAGWTPRQVVHHAADSEMTSAIRLRRLLAEEQPLIGGYDEELFARRLFYDRPIAASLAAVEAARASTAELLERMSEDDWRREGTHSESGRYTCEDWLRIYAAHCHDHAEQIRRAVSGAAAG